MGALAPTLVTPLDQERYPSSRATSGSTPDPISTDPVTGEVIDRRSIYATPSPQEAVVARPVLIEGYQPGGSILRTTESLRPTDPLSWR